MTTVEILAKVKEIMAEVLDADNVDMDTSIKSDLGADPTELIDLMLALEEAFDIDITDSEFAEIDTVEDAVEYIQNALD